MKNFVLIPQHTSPDSAVEEVNALYDVVADVRTRWNANVNAFFNSTNTATQNIDNLVVKYEMGVGVVKPVQSLCRTSCCWATSTQAATT